MNPLSFLAHPRMPLVRDFTLAVLAVLGLFFALTVHGYEQSFYRQIIALFLLLTLIMVKLYGSYNTRLSLPGNSFSLWFSAFTGWVLLSMAWSPIPGGSFLSALTFSFGLLAMLLSFWANERQWFFFRSLLIPLALLVVAATSYQAFVLKVARPAGFLMNWNTNSAFLGAILLPYCAVYLYQMTQWPMDTSGNKATQNPLAPRKRATAVKLSRHTGMDCRYPEHREVNLARPPWPLGSGIPCRNDGFFLNLMAVKRSVGTTQYCLYRNPLELLSGSDRYVARPTWLGLMSSCWITLSANPYVGRKARNRGHYAARVFAARYKMLQSTHLLTYE